MSDDVTARDVRETYETIAGHFSETRASPWPEVEAFVADAGHRGTALDIGCGNGRHAAVLADAAECVLGLDASRNLLGEAVTKVDAPVEWLQGDAARLPLRADSVDLAVYIATLHHLPTRSGRVASLNELARVLATDGRALVSAWSTAHDRFDASAEAESGFDTTVEWTLPDGEVLDRFYHIYAPAEFDADIEESALSVVDSRVSSGNCYAEVTGPQ